MGMQIPFLDLFKTHEAYMPEFRDVFEVILRKSSFVGGEYLERFEAEWADYCGTSYAVGVSSGTSAISLTLQALGIGAGDEVLVPANTFFATAEAVTHAGATPVFCDVSPQTYNLTCELAEQKLTARTKAVIGVHLYGQLCDAEELSAWAKQKNIIFLEDAAQAHGARRNGKAAGAFGMAGCFSFYPGKNLGSLGEGGAVVTNDAQLAQKIKAWREHGQLKKHEHLYPGFNHRLHTMQAAFLSIKLKGLDQANNSRRQVARWYFENLQGIKGLTLAKVENWDAHVFHIFSVFTAARLELANFLQTRGIGTGFHYPVLCSNQPAYSDLGYKKGDFPQAEILASTQLSLPMFPQLTEAEVKAVAQSLREYFNAH